LLTRGKEVIVERLLGLLVWVVDVVVVWYGYLGWVKERSCCNDDRGASSLVKVSDKVRAIKNWGFCIDRNAEKLQSWKQKMTSLVGREVLLKAMGGGNTKLHDLVYLIPSQFLIGNL
jgi:hypothetical protein